MNVLWFPFPGQLRQVPFHTSTGTKPRVKAAYKRRLPSSKHPLAVRCSSAFTQYRQNVPGQPAPPSLHWGDGSVHLRQRAERWRHQLMCSPPPAIASTPCAIPEQRLWFLKERGAQHPAAHLGTEHPALTHVYHHKGTVWAAPAGGS